MSQFFKPEVALEILEQYHNQIIGVVFVKRSTGEVRELNGHLDVSKYVNGKGMSYTPSEYNLATIFDLKIARSLPESERKKAYRCINLEKVMEIRAQGRLYKPFKDK